MKNLRLATVGAACALGLVACFFVGVVLMVSSGVQVLIPEAGGADARDWIADVNDAGTAFDVGAWLTILGGFLGIVALVGFADALKEAGPVVRLVPLLGAVGLTLVTISHLLPIAMAHELVPDYVDAGVAGKASISTTFDLLATSSLFLNTAGNALGWAVVVPLLGVAILKTRVVGHWIGWLALFVGLTGGWIGLFSAVWSPLEAVSFPGFIGFFVFMASMGVSLLRGARREELPTAVSATR